MSLAFDRWVVAPTHQCTLDVVWGVAAIWAVAGLDHTIDVSKVVLWLFHSCHDYFLSPLPCISPLLLFLCWRYFLPKKNAILLSKKSEWWKWNNMVTSYLFMEQT